MSRLLIDWTRCDGHGLCAALVPEHITRDEWGFPVITNQDLDPKTARALVSICPALALRLGSEPPRRTAQPDRKLIRSTR